MVPSDNVFVKGLKASIGANNFESYPSVFFLCPNEQKHLTSQYVDVFSSSRLY